MKNAGKACNNRLYRHIRTFEKIIKNYFVIYDEMLDIARKLSANIPHVRVDFYYINNKIYVGELTFFHCGGLQRIEPKSWEKKMGEWIDVSMI